MRPQPVTPEFLTQPFGDAGDRDSGGVGARDRSRRAERLESFEQRAFHAPVLGNGLDDPIATFDPGKVILEVSYGDHARGFGNEERRRARLQGGVESGLGKMVADLRVRQRQALGLRCGGQPARDDVQENGGD